MTTAPDADEAEKLASSIVAEKLAACVQILPPMMSVYLWEGSIQKETEYLILIKTLPEKFESLSEFITSNHSYEVPEIVAIDVEKVSGPYISWMKDVIG